MKVLTIVDIHKSETAYGTIKQFIRRYEPDVLIIAGDITTFGPLEFAKEFLEILPDVKTLAVPGNCDPHEILPVIDESKAINLHGRSETIDGVTFVGLGGSNSTPFNTPFELSELDIYNKLDSIMEPGEVLVLHFPVLGYLDEVPGGGHTGSVSALKIVEKYQPSIVISGHIHETRGTKSDKKGTLYLNPGPIKDGYAALVDITPKSEKSQSTSSVKYDCKIQLLSTPHYD